MVIALETEAGECYLFLISLELVVTRTLERGSTLNSDQALATAASTTAASSQFSGNRSSKLCIYLLLYADI